MVVHCASAQGFIFTKLVRNSSDGLRNGMELRARNDSTVPLAITRLTLSKCINLRVSCDTTYVNMPAIMPGEERAILSYLALVSSQPIDFAYSAEWRPATECYNGVGGVGPEKVKPRPPEMRTMVVPPTGGPKGAQVGVSFFVAAGGSIDSIVFDRPMGAAFGKKFRATLMGYKFVPANDSYGCPAAAVYTITVTFH